jgi:hypothetical protein
LLDCSIFIGPNTSGAHQEDGWNVCTLEHLQPFEASGPKSGDIFAQIECKTGVGGIFFPVITPAFTDIVSK